MIKTYPQVPNVPLDQWWGYRYSCLIPTPLERKVFKECLELSLDQEEAEAYTECRLMGYSITKAYKHMPWVAIQNQERRLAEARQEGTLRA